MWRFVRFPDFNFLAILFFTAIGISLVYGIDFVYRQLKRKRKEDEST